MYCGPHFAKGDSNMKIKIDRLLRDVPVEEFPVEPLSPKRQERILMITMNKIKQEQQPKRRGRKPLTMLVAAAALVALLCGTALAAYELNLFDFSRLFGEEASIIEENIVTYTPAPEDAVPAFTGLNDENHMSVKDYNFTLCGDVEASDTLIYATFDISKVSEDIPGFTDSGFTLGIEGYESKSFLRGIGDFERVVVYASLTEPLTESDTLTFVMTNGSNTETVFANAPITLSEANMAVFTEPNPDADYVLDTASLTDADLTVTGHFQKEFDDYAAALDAAGTFSPDTLFWPLYDQFMDTYDEANAVEDQEGYLVVRDIQTDGTFTLQWAFVKNIFAELGMTVNFGGEKYVIPEQDAPQPEVLEEIKPSESTVADTQDYRFSLESMVADSNVIYAIVDMEPLTDYGRAHMNLDDQELTIACGNLTAKSSGSVGSVLIESGEDMSRYLVYCISDSANQQVGDLIYFEILNIIEDGDTLEHSYALFNVTLDSINHASATAERVSDLADGQSEYTDVTITPMSLRMQTEYHGEPDEGMVAADRAFADPEITLTFKNGDSYTIMGEGWYPNNADFGEYGIVMGSCRGDGTESDGTMYKTYLFSQLVSLEELDTITIDGVVYQVHYEIA